MHAHKGKELATVEKQENKRIFGIRIKVEHAIGSMKNGSSGIWSDKLCIKKKKTAGHIVYLDNDK